MLEEAEFIIKKCLNYNFSKLQKQDKKELFKKKDLKIIGDEIISKKISDYLEKTTSIKVSEIAITLLRNPHELRESKAGNFFRITEEEFFKP